MMYFYPVKVREFQGLLSFLIDSYKSRAGIVIPIAGLIHSCSTMNINFGTAAFSELFAMFLNSPVYLKFSIKARTLNSLRNKLANISSRKHFRT